jgi:hypothetical protein
VHGDETSYFTVSGRLRGYLRNCCMELARASVRVGGIAQLV